MHFVIFLGQQSLVLLDKNISTFIFWLALKWIDEASSITEIRASKIEEDVMLGQEPGGPI